MNKNRKQPRRTARFEKKLAAYTLAGAAALIVPTAAKASVVLVNVDEGFTEGGPSFSFPGSPFEGDIAISAEPDFTPLGTYNEIDASTTGGANVMLNGPSSEYAAALGVNTPIDPSSGNWGTSGKLVGSSSSFIFPTGGDWSTTGGDAFLGFDFEGTGGLHAGWVEIGTTANSANSSFEVLSYAYETSADTPIITPASLTPEPSALPLLALGGVGLIALRRRRAANA
jgi:hypothetical protein